jgi:hypothetical protein
MELESSRRIFEKFSNNKFRENPSSGSGDVSCGQKPLELIDALRISAKAPKNNKLSYLEICTQKPK